MSVPLDRLYNFLHDLCNRDDLIIYRFLPHGSRKIEDLTKLKGQGDVAARLKKFAIFYDQEPLNFNLYNNPKLFDSLLETSINYAEVKDLLTEELHKKFTTFIERTIEHSNLKIAINNTLHNVPVILVHSEKRSLNLEIYQSYDFITVYWWSHGLIARDWFRFAECDPALSHRKATKDFLVYNRAWSGTREYRLKLAELIIENKLTNSCYMGFNPVDGEDYRCHQFTNPAFQISNTSLEDHFHLNTTPSTASADYVSADYQSTEIEIILETLFDDDRLQLTEKTLRPIACGHPFMLVGPHGSLEYLRSYGFETFGHLINEDYDKIVDPSARLNAIVSEMKRLADLPTAEKNQLYASMRITAQKNKELFFSKMWENQIIDEFKTNFSQAYSELDRRLKEKFKNFNLF